MRKIIKKLFFIVLIANFISCESPKSDAEKLCDCITKLQVETDEKNAEIQAEINELKSQNTTDATLKSLDLATKMLGKTFDNECFKMQAEMLEKYKNDTEKQFEFFKEFENCNSNSITNKTLDVLKKDEKVSSALNDLDNEMNKVKSVKSEIEVKYYLYCGFLILFGIALAYFGLARFSIALALSFFVPSIVTLGMLDWLSFSWFTFITIVTILIFLLSKLLIYFNAWFFITILISLPFAMIVDYNTLNIVVKAAMLLSIPIVYFLRNDLKKIIIGISSGFAVGFGISGIVFAQSISNGNLFDAFTLPALILFVFIIFGLIFQYKEKFTDVIKTLKINKNETNDSVILQSENKNNVLENVVAKSENLDKKNTFSKSNEQSKIKLNPKTLILMFLGLIILSIIIVLMFKKDDSKPNDAIKTEIESNKVSIINPSQLPKSLEYEGIIKEAIQWKDNSGEHFVFITETGSFMSEKFSHENEGMDAELFAYYYTLNNDNSTLNWKVYDYITDCPVDIQAQFVKNTLQVTDLDNNGIVEIWVMYKTACSGDVSPSNMKIIMYEGKQKHAMRGTSKVAIGINDNGSPMYSGGEYGFDTAFGKKPKEFKDFAIDLWNKNVLNGQESNSISSELTDETLTNDKNNQELYHIVDPDGYSNLRSSPKGDVIRKVFTDEFFDVIEERDNHFLVKFSDNSEGYIHKSRVFKVND